jgi:hypothetical protein
VNADAASVPPSPSPPLPVKLIVSPARYVVPAAGETGQASRQQDDRDRRRTTDQCSPDVRWRVDDRVERIRVGTDDRGDDDRDAAKRERDECCQPWGHGRRIEGSGILPT